MAEESVSILKVDTGEAVKSVNDLKENIKILKGQLGELTIGSQEYQDTLEELTINQNALKNAMHATTASMEEVVAAAASMNVEFDEQNKLINKGTISYNELVHTMAALKEEWRATTDEVRRSELGAKIDEINSRLKEMDASTGNFSRNVGNYESGFKNVAATFDKWGETLKQLPPTLGPVKESIGKVGETMQLVGKQPILGIVGLLTPIIMKITAALGENETAMGAVKKLMESLQPVFDILQDVLEGIAQGVAKAVDWFVELIGQGEALNTIIKKASGVGNAILQYILTPVRTAINAFKGLGNIIKDIFTGQFSKIKEDAAAAWEGIKEGFKEGFSFKENFEEGEQKGAAFVEGMKANRAAAKAAGKETAESFKEGMKEVEFDEDADAERAQAEEDAYFEELARLEKAEKAKTDAIMQGALERMEAQEAAAQKEIELNKAVQDAITAEIDEQNKKREESEKQRAANTKAIMSAAASATSQILSTIADAYESDEKSAKENAKKIKGLRIAAATIDMIQGATTAFASAMQLGPIAGPIMGAINAGLVITTGMMNINKIKSTDPTGASGGSSAPSTPAAVSAPNIDTSLPAVRNITSASEEDRLNQMASPQKVYILQSDIEAAGKHSRVQVAESSF